MTTTNIQPRTILEWHGCRYARVGGEIWRVPLTPKDRTDWEFYCAVEDWHRSRAFTESKRETTP